MVEKGCQRLLHSGNLSHIGEYFPQFTRATQVRYESIVFNSAHQRVEILIYFDAQKLGACGIARNIARVTPPIPGPNSMITLAEAIPEASTIRRSRNRELGIIDPICSGCFKNS